MARKQAHVSETPATAWLRRAGVAFSEHVYDYVEHGGTAESARQLGVDEHAVVKTLVMEDEAARPLIVLMHGDSTSRPRRWRGRSAQTHRGVRTGRRGAAQRLSSRRDLAVRDQEGMPIYVEAAILELPASTSTAAGAGSW